MNPFYGDDNKCIKTKIKACGGSVNTNFQGKGVPKEKEPCKCLSIIMLHSVAKTKKKIILKRFWRNANVNQKR